MPQYTMKQPPTEPTPLGAPVDALLAALYKERILCWLDSGTLLGVCRDGRPPAWDKDIDLACWKEDLPRAREVINDFASRWGYNVLEKHLGGEPYAVLLRPGFILTPRPDGMLVRRKELPMAIHLFTRSQGVAESLQPHNLLSQNAEYARYKLAPKDKRREILGRPGSNKPGMRDRIRYRLILILTSSGGSLVFQAIIKQLEKRSANKGILRHPSERLALSWLFEYFVWKVPVRFFDRFQVPPGYPEFVKIPADYEDYLRLRYADWRKPVQQWNYTLDDGLLDEKPDNTVN